nr:hypothetical protein [uncultured Desulfobacter sp.]
MKDSLQIVERAAAHARREPVPDIDISYQVMARLHRQDPVTSFWPQALFAGGAAMAAGVAVLAGLPLLDLLTDPWSACAISVFGIFI